MSSLTGSALLQKLAERVLMRWLVRQGQFDVKATGGLASFGGRTVDLTHSWQGGIKRIKVKADPYFGTDQSKITDRSLAFYRARSDAYAFEAVANSMTREPGWIVESSADELFYYFLTLSQPEDELAALINEPEDVLFSELRVDQDELVIMPMKATADWFAANFERYTPRPVMVEGVSAWYRLVPRRDIEGAVSGIRSVGPIIKTLIP